ncbi:hypothetical protein KDW_21300 [Dictyobacter vulcani]|uniref:Uncharacterized protein n=1 Tax=Dictyobacter vulcani TaxID=2607529 RepID=A0A5J4KF34_9CHLR|nr:hypothetical protein [Dictyobacter vulcani]GER87968.1 hypothetical protein KDW_21300 [Dictyobacter vulcani]
MSQQEFMPESRRQREADQNNEEIYGPSYSQYRTSDMPKRDHPADFEAKIPPYSYQAQEIPRYNEQEAIGASQARSDATRQRQQPGRRQADIFTTTRRIGDILQQGYRFYQRQRQRQRQRWQMSNTQRQSQRTGPSRLWVILLLGIGILCALPVLIKLLLILFAALIVSGIMALLLIVSALIIYQLYFKKYWRRSRWW